MPSVALLNQSGEKVKNLKLTDVFATPFNQQVIYDVVNAQRAAMRQGTHDTKNRSEVRGGGKKPWRQKGTGHARQGSINAPQWRHGGIVFGPTPRSYEVKVNKKVRQIGLKSALSFHAANNTLTLVDDIKFDTIKTKNFGKFLEDIKVSGKTLVVVSELTAEVALSARNFANVFVTTADQASVFDILAFKNLVLTEGAVKYYEEALA
jgi:large subunit ribosomal protein L4